MFSALRRLALRLWHTVRPSHVDADAEREIAAHLALIEEAQLRRGLSPADARREARRILGGATQARTSHREARAFRWVDEAAQDAVHASRLLRRAPGFTAAVLVTIALAVGVATSVTAVVYGVLFRPLPYEDPDRIVRVWEEHPGAVAPFPGAHLSDRTYHAWRDAGLSTVAEIGAFRYASHTVTGLPRNEHVAGAALTPSLPRLLRLVPAAGRFFLEADAEPGAARVVVLAHAFWHAHFGGDPAAVGRTLTLDNESHEIVGVAPAGFRFPAPGIGLYTPYAVERPQGNGMNLLTVVARLPAGVTPARAAAEGTSAARSVERPMVADVMFGTGEPVIVNVQPMAAVMTAGVRPALLTLAGAVALLLVVACANVANLFLAHGVGRGQELSVRASLGATGGRLLRQLLTEGLGLAAAGGTLGLLAGAAIVRAVPRLAPEHLPRVDAVYFDWPAALAALASMVVVGVGAAVVGARRHTRQAGMTAPDAGSRSVAATRSGLRSTLLVVEATLAVLLLVGAGLLMRSFAALVHVDAGYDPAHVVTASLHVARTMEDAERATLATDVLERVRALPGVRAAGIGSMAPFSGSIGRFGFRIPGAVAPDGSPLTAYAWYSAITDGYTEALGMRLVEGRSIAPADYTAPVRAMLVNETFVRRYFHDGEPVAGRQFTGMLGADDTVVEIVGVVADVLPVRLDAQPEAQIYLAQGGPFGMRQMSLVVGTERVTSTLLSDTRTIVESADADAAVGQLGPLDAKLADSVATPRVIMLVLVSFALLALLLAAAGLYGVLSHVVTARARELGIRAALGARRTTLLGMVLRQGLSVTVVGLLIGLVAAAILARALHSQLFGIQPVDPVTFIVAPLILLIAATAACLVPALRAAASDPADALRNP